MKRLFLLVVGTLLIAINVFAADGDFIVDGSLGIGTDTPGAKLDVNGSIKVPNTNWSGIYFGNTYTGLVWRPYAGGIPGISSHTLALGDDGYLTQIYYDTIWDGSIGYCEGAFDTGTPSHMVNCSNYSALMDENDFYWVWKHGFPDDSQTWCTGDCRESRRDYKFLFDGESNDGVMGYLEDEDAFFFDDDVIFNGYVGIGTMTPNYPLQMGGGAYTDGNDWYPASSRAYKENIINLQTDEAINALVELNPVTFNYKNDKEEKHVGFIAEDVPDLVATKERKGLSPLEIAALLTSVVKEQQRTIEELKSRIQKLEARDLVVKVQQ